MMVKVKRWCGCFRTDCCLRTDGWYGHSWVPEEWAEDERRVEEEKRRETENEQ